MVRTLGEMLGSFSAQRPSGSMRGFGDTVHYG